MSVNGYASVGVTNPYMIPIPSFCPLYIENYSVCGSLYFHACQRGVVPTGAQVQTVVSFHSKLCINFRIDAKSLGYEDVLEWPF